MNSEFSNNTNNNTPVVSIICNTYNHEKYVADAIESFLIQKTDFPIEILIHDDASTDNTANIIKQYENKYPNIIKPVYQVENQYSKGDSIISKIQYNRILGKYTALCEGDDYWDDPFKLQKQFDILEKHPEINLSAHAAKIVSSDTKKVIGKISPQNYDGIITTDRVIYGGGGFFSTNSLFFRSKILTNLPEFYYKCPFDRTLQILGSLYNGVYYFNETMSSYRRFAEGSWTSRNRYNVEYLMHFNKLIRDMLIDVNKYSNYNFSDSIELALLKNEYSWLDLNGQYKKMLSKKYIYVRKHNTFKENVRVYILAICPFIKKYKLRLKCKQ